MSIAHLGLADQREPGESRGHERTPPHDLLAEQSALGDYLEHNGNKLTQQVVDIFELLLPWRQFRFFGKDGEGWGKW